MSRIEWLENIGGMLVLAFVGAFSGWALLEAVDEGYREACEQSPKGCSDAE